jgi:hypothetical protein
MVRKIIFPTKICEASTKYLKAHYYHQATNQGDASSLCTPKLTLARIGPNAQISNLNLGFIPLPSF